MSAGVYARRTCLLYNEPPHPLTEETQEGYSDTGYPTLPRPKAILSIPRPDSPWSAHEASQLQTVSLRVLNGKSQLVRTPESPTSVTSLLPKNHRPPIVRSSSVANSGTSGKEPCHVTKTQRAACRKEGGHRKPIETTLSAISNLQRANCSLPVADSDRLTQSLPCRFTGLRSCLDAANMSQGKAGKKAPKRPARALSFSFGTSSSAERKRRTLTLFGTMRRRPTDDTAGGKSLQVASTPIAPSSPILMGSRRSRTMPGGLIMASTIQQQSIREERDSVSSLEAESWCSKAGEDDTGAIVGRNHCTSHEDLNGMHPNSHKSKSRRPKRPTLPLYSASSNGSPDGQSHRTLDLSPADGKNVPSIRESVEPQIYSVQSDPSDTPTPSSTPPSVTYSPRPSPGSHKTFSRPPSSSGSSASGSPIPACSTSPRLTRKMSDPGNESPLMQRAMVKGEQDPPSTERSPRSGRALKKGHTFCVRSSREEPNWREMRHHVVRFLLETEQSYVQSLRAIIKVYLEPLKRPQVAGLTDANLVRDIFYQIPEICSLHERFLTQLSQRVEHWHPLQKIGDIFVNTFSKCQLMDIYSRFIQNFMRAKSAIDIAKQSRPVFAKFLEQRARDVDGRLSLDDLLIKPVQRIPRYALFIKDLLKHTSASHPDHSPLLQALGELTTLAERVNESQRESHRLERQRELLTSIDGLALLLNSVSKLLRYDLITEIKGTVQKKDRFLILFSDVVVCASSRRRSTSFKRGSLLNLNSFLPEALRYKIKWHAPLTHLSIAQVQAPLLDHKRQNTLEKIVENLRSDETALQQIAELSNSLHKAHQPLTSVVRDMLLEVREGLELRREELGSLPQEAARIDLVSYAGTSPQQYSLIFPSPRIRELWEREFLLAKDKADRQAPPTSHVAPPTSPPPTPGHISRDLQFLNPLLLQSGRIGTQLTCAAVGLPVDCESTNCLWVCCSDGFGGQVCLLNLEHSTQPQLVANITVSDSQILCITAIPSSEEEGEEGTGVPAEVNLQPVTDSLQSGGSAADGGNEASIEPQLLPSVTYSNHVNKEPANLSTSDTPIGSLPSSDTSSDLSSQVSVSRTPSSASEVFSVKKDVAIAIRGKEEGENEGEEEEEEGEKEGEEEEEGKEGEEERKGRYRDESVSPDSLQVLTRGLLRDGSSTGMVSVSVEKGEAGADNAYPFLRGQERADLFQRPSRSSFPIPPPGFRRVRSNSAPPDPERGVDLTSGLRVPARELEEMSRSPSPPSSPPLPHPSPVKSSLSVDPRITKAWSPLTLRPSEGGSPSDRGFSCVWLGTEGGQIHVYTAGNNLRSRSKRQTVDMGAPVHCIRYYKRRVYVGLGNGTVAIMDPQDAVTSSCRHCIALGSDPVVSCVPAVGHLWAACGGTIYRLDPTDRTGKPIATLPSEQSIHAMVAIGNCVWVSVKNSPVLHLYHTTPSTLTPSLLTTVDCTGAVMKMLKGYDAIIRQHKSSGLRITSLLPLPSSNSLLVGTSAGSILFLSLPPVDIDPNEGMPRPLLALPTPVPILKGHVDNVHFLASMPQGSGTLVLSGGSGFEDFASAGTSQGFPETASCLLIWKSSS